MKRLLWLWCGLLALVSATTPAFGQATIISSITPTSALDGSSSFTMTLQGTFLTTNNVGVCFYTGYNIGRPIVPATFNNTTAVVTIPATALSSVPASAFSGGTFTASVFLAARPATAIHRPPSTPPGAPRASLSTRPPLQSRAPVLHRSANRREPSRSRSLRAPFPPSPPPPTASASTPGPPPAPSFLRSPAIPRL